MLEIPQGFKDGLDKKVSTVYPIVVIQKGSDVIRLSQNKGMLRVPALDSDFEEYHYFEDRGLKISSIKESIDIADRNFKTSQITINVSNYIYNNERFSDKFDTFIFTNSDASIYYANANSKNLDDCLLVFKGFIKDYSCSNDRMSFKVEDHSQYTVNDKTLPRHKTFDASAETIERSKNAFFPITYGHNTKAPLLFTRTNNLNTESQIFADSVFREDIEIGGFQLNDVGEDEFIDTDHCLSVFREDQYHKIPNKIVGLPSPFIVNGKDYADPSIGYNNTDQYELSEAGDVIILDKKIRDDGYAQGLDLTLQAREQFLCEVKRKVTGVSADSSGPLAYGGSLEAEYIGPDDGYDIIEITDPSSESKIFKFPDMSNPALLEERGFYNGVVLGGFKRVYKVRPYQGGFDWTTWTVNLTSGIYHLTAIAYASGSNANSQKFDMTYVPSVDEILIYFNPDFEYESVEWYYAESDHIDFGFMDNISWEHHINVSYAQDMYGWVEPPYQSIPSKVFYSGDIRKRYGGLRFTFADESTQDVGLDADWLPATLAQVFLPEVLAWMTSAGDSVTLRKILWGRRIYYDAESQGADEAQGKFNKGAMAYGLFPTFAKCAVNSHSFTRLVGAGSAGSEGGIMYQNPYYVIDEVEFVVDTLYCFMNPYYSNPSDPLSYDTEQFETLTSSLNNFDLGAWDESKFVATEYRSDGWNEDKAIVAFAEIARTTADEYSDGEYAFVESWGAPVEVRGMGTILTFGGAWCPIEYDQQNKLMAKLNLTFNSISGNDVVEGGVYSRIKGKVITKVAKVADTGQYLNFAVELDALKQTQDYYNEDAITNTYLSSMAQTTIDPVSLEPVNYYTEYSTASDITNSDVEVDIDFDPSDDKYIFTECNKHAGQTDSAGSPVPDQWRANVNSINSVSLIYNIYDRSSVAAEATSVAQCSFSTEIHNFELFQKFIIENISKQKYFGNVKGRLDDSEGRYTGTASSLMENPADIFYHIMEKELGYSNQDGMDPTSLERIRSTHGAWKFAFSINEEIEAKDFIKDFSQSTKFIPRFRHDGTLGFIELSDNIGGAEGGELIEARDVVSFKYSKTPISDVKLMVQVAYDYDMGLEEYQACTNKGNGGAIPYDSGTLQELYGIKNLDDAFLRFESKYIKDEQTAIYLRNFLLCWLKNQHNIIECTLPVSYLGLECGDIVRFDSLIQDTKIFGKDYTEQYTIYDGDLAQEVLPGFIVEEITKSQDKVKVKLFQLHFLDYGRIHPDYSLDQDYSAFYIPPDITDDSEEDDAADTITLYLGDTNADGLVNVLDVVAIVSHVVAGGSGITNQYSLMAADVNQDQLINVLDVVAIVSSVVNQVDLGTIEV